MHLRRQPASAEPPRAPGFGRWRPRPAEPNVELLKTLTVGTKKVIFVRLPRAKLEKYLRDVQSSKNCIPNTIISVSLKFMIFCLGIPLRYEKSWMGNSN